MHDTPFSRQERKIIVREQVVRTSVESTITSKIHKSLLSSRPSLLSIHLHII